MQLNAIPGKINTYSVSFDCVTRLLTIESNNIVPYSLLFYSGDFKDEIDLTSLAIMSINTPARLLGFGLNDYSSINGTITSPIPMDLDNFMNRMYLHIEADGKNLDRMEQSAGRRDCFYIFFFQPGAAEYTFLDKETVTPIFTSSPAPLARVSNLEISMRDEFNRLINLNHREMNLIFEITHLE
jgi:hypothetical protein